MQQCQYRLGDGDNGVGVLSGRVPKHQSPVQQRERYGQGQKEDDWQPLLDAVVSSK